MQAPKLQALTRMYTWVSNYVISENNFLLLNRFTIPIFCVSGFHLDDEGDDIIRNTKDPSTRKYSAIVRLDSCTSFGSMGYCGLQCSPFTSVLYLLIPVAIISNIHQSWLQIASCIFNF